MNRSENKVASMTAFARHESSHWIWEIRSVNHRFLDVSVNLPPVLQSIEPKLISHTRERLSRGRIEASLSYAQATTSVSSHVNETELRQLLLNISKLQSNARDPEFGNLQFNRKLNPLDVLRWPGILNQEPHIATRVEEDIFDVFDLCLTKLIDVRKVEGKALKASFEVRLSSIKENLTSLAAHSGTQLQFAQSRLNQRIKKLGVEVEPQQLASEVALLAQKADVDEEIDRLKTHIDEFESCLNQENPHGRRLGFIVQEMARESNTLAAKLMPPEAINLSVNLKVLIDQIREQVQNVE